MCAFVFFNDTATTEIYTLSLHDALPIFDITGLAGLSEHDRPRSVVVSARSAEGAPVRFAATVRVDTAREALYLRHGDRKSTRLNSSHANISYAVFCLKKKNTNSASCSAS